MPFRKYRRTLAIATCISACGGATGFAQSGFEAQGGEYPVAGVLPGDQVAADLALNEGGGYVVWQDSRTDGDGFGISAVRLGSTLNTGFDSFRINSIGAGNQQSPSIAGFSDGGHLVVWEGDPSGTRGVYGRIILSDGTFASDSDIKINAFNGGGAIKPAVAGLSNGNAVVVWSSYGQDDAANPVASLRGLRGVYGRLVSPDGTFLSGEILINQTVQYNQRTPSVAALESGDFVVVWATERVVAVDGYTDAAGLNIMGRVFSGVDGTALTGEFQINQSSNICATPKVAGARNGGFTVTWSERVRHDRHNSWDIAVRHFPSATGSTGNPQRLVNTHQYGDQFAPQIDTSGDYQMIVWSSMGQDGSYEGVFGRYMSGDQFFGGELQVNSTSISKQIQPTVAAQSDNSLLVVWSSFVGGNGSVDLQAQRYGITIPAPEAPVVSALSDWQLFVAWPEVAGMDVESYQVYFGNGQEPLLTSENFIVIEGLDAGSTYSVRMTYTLAGGLISPVSDPAFGTTYGRDRNHDGLPDDWQEEQFGSDQTTWGLPGDDSDGDGVSNRDEFLAGTSASSADSVLRMGIEQSPQGWVLSWNSVPGLVYKVQESTTLGNWDDVGGYRFSAGEVDATFVEPVGGNQYFRVIRIR